MSHVYDVVVIGGGPGGSQTSTLLAQKGLRVLLMERLEFPRFRIGESLLPASMPLLQRSGFYAKLSGGEYIEKFGARFVDYETDEEIYFGFDNGINATIAGAFQVPRAKFDADLLDHAAKSGVEIWQPCPVEDMTVGESEIEIKTERGTVTARFVVDASGRQALVGKKLSTKKVGGDFNNLGVYAHFKNVKREAGRNEGDIRIGLLRDKSWSWQIPFKGDITSVGVVSCAREMPKKNLGEYLVESVCGTPKMAHYMSEAEMISEPDFVSNYGQECETFWGDRWLLVGDAAKFLDPCFSSGVHNSLQSGTLAADCLERACREDLKLSDDNLGANYEKEFRKGLERFTALISIFYRGNFVQEMKRVLQRKELERAFTSAVAGDMWNDENILFQKNIL